MGESPDRTGASGPGGRPAPADPDHAGPGDYLKAAALGLFAACIAALVWSKLAQLTGLRFGVVGLFLSLGVPVGMRIGAEGRTGPAMPSIAAGLSALAMLLGYAMIEVDESAKSGSAAHLPWLIQLPRGLAAVITSGSPWNWVMVGFAAWQGWSVMRQKAALQGVKERVLQGLPERLEFGQAYPDQYPGLDRVSLERWTEKLQDLGFEWSQDFRPVNPPPGWPPGMARLFVHKQQRCYAEIGQVFPPGRPPLVWCSVTSYLDDGWSLSTSNLSGSDPSLFALRRPRELWSRHPGAEPDQLYYVHMDFRYRLASDFALGVPEVSPAAYQAQQQKTLEGRRALVEGMTDAQLVAEHRSAQAQPAMQWWGEWATATHGRVVGSGYWYPS